MTTLSRRLKEARRRKGISQEQLGIRVGLDPASASARMNRYELGKRVPDFELVERLADELGVPASYFYASDEQEADLLAGFHRLTPVRKAQLLDCVEQLLADSED